MGSRKVRFAIAMVFAIVGVILIMDSIEWRLGVAILGVPKDTVAILGVVLVIPFFGNIAYSNASHPSRVANMIILRIMGERILLRHSRQIWIESDVKATVPAHGGSYLKPLEEVLGKCFRQIPLSAQPTYVFLYLETNIQQHKQIVVERLNGWGLCNIIHCDVEISEKQAWQWLKKNMNTATGEANNVA